jgi:hypothetical protein
MLAIEKFEGIAKFVKTDENLTALREHLECIINGEAFRGSKRSAQFLSFIVEKAIENHADGLKERTIGVELFGRVPTYDTGEDAIVRVTATDVRRRLLQHYGRIGEASEFRISLHAGGYIPEIERHGTSLLPIFADSAATPEVSAIIKTPVSPLAGVEKSHPISELAHPQTDEGPQAATAPSSSPWKLIAALSLIVAVPVVVLIAWGMKPALRSPWSAVMRLGHVTRLIASDPDISQVEALTSRQISVSDYANEQYGCDQVTLPRDVPCFAVFHGDKYAAVDVNLLDPIKEIARRANIVLQVQAARNVRLPSLRTNDDYILLGSARSNPWVQLFANQMDFVFSYNNEAKQEIVENRNPRTGELAQYVPTAKGFGTGESYATVSLLRNLNQTGRVLLLAGNSSEATQAAGDFITDQSDVAAELTRCGIRDLSPLARYQVLLKVQTMAGSATQVSVLACHQLS